MARISEKFETRNYATCRNTRILEYSAIGMISYISEVYPPKSLYKLRIAFLDLE
ncbi:uncharacterized protein SPAPADRAFT_60919 [Spathaspora passalidarum NRRL Y-27907]|uniref:Uncharacterized protein n=1 Tax=Spathaspora passalidarum (strain NRRL Y-27907 / 11-Y1) TaxID=619300 RepID=G3AKB6_SPAPN|nr:uncharacterized protein SPAPADRAFT_60919 [Spathaspora passalidarum NRRL Y-27907]EGW33575.1 hypothetical protein SPAPADRAFT_60919 [Spathaspora passalidarum NRRL Y-27907]